MVEGNCVTALQRVPPAGPGVWASCSPLLSHFTGNKHAFRGQVDQCAASSGQIILEHGTGCLFGTESAFLLFVFSPVAVLYFIPSAVCQETLVGT